MQTAGRMNLLCIYDTTENAAINAFQANIQKASLKPPPFLGLKKEKRSIGSLTFNVADHPFPAASPRVPQSIPREIARSRSKFPLA